MSKKPALTKAMLEEVSHLSSKDAAAKLGYGKTTITDARARFDLKRTAKPGPIGRVGGESFGKAATKSSSLQETGTGLIVESTGSVPQTKDDIGERMRAKGFDPGDYVFTYGFSEWEAQTPDGIQTMYSARASATERRKPASDEGSLSYDDVVAMLDEYVPIRGEKADIEPSGIFVFCFADPQVGKTDINGGTKEMVARFMASIDHACAILDESPATQVIWADLGDGIENFCNTSSQRQTNDLNLVEQVRVLRRLQAYGIARMLEYAPVVHVSVPSNHSQNRVGPQQAASTSHDDWGLEVQQQLEEIFHDRKDFKHAVKFVQPEMHLESVSTTAEDGSEIGFVHGHRSTTQNGLESWWAGQALGEQPTADAKILLVGHFHNYSLRSVGKEKYIITTPALDNGSSWFTVSRGNVATAGVLTMRIRNNVPTDMRIV